jgi:hypothetical protein
LRLLFVVLKVCDSAHDDRCNREERHQPTLTPLFGQGATEHEFQQQSPGDHYERPCEHRKCRLAVEKVPGCPHAVHLYESVDSGLVVILWYIADSAVYLFRYYSRQGREAGRDSGQSPFKLTPAKIAGYNWVRCGGCGGVGVRLP